jgi:catechol 2,3-dioxygenase-like lactoylglutathione lyase family enzyme
VHLHSLTFDCADPPALAAFWAAVTGYAIVESHPWLAMLTGDGSFGPRLMFLKVPEPKAAKNRVHMDLGTANLDIEVARVLALGAALVGHRQEYGITWSTFADPEGNEFCVGLHPAP